MKFKIGDWVVATSKRYIGLRDNPYEGEFTFKFWLSQSPLSIGKIQGILYDEVVRQDIIHIRGLWFFEDELVLIKGKDEQI